MALEAVVRDLALVLGAMLFTAIIVIVGPRRFVRALSELRWRAKAAAVSVGLLLTVLLIRVLGSDLLHLLQIRVFGRNITGNIHRIEQTLFPVNPVIYLQGLAVEPLTSYFVFIYIYGYAFLLLFPLIAYFSLRKMDRFTSLMLAFTANYAIGLVFYTIFIAYGPRNQIPIEVAHLLYDAYPQSRFLTNEVNQNTNVFPSLHTSLSMTVFFMAWITRDEYPVWLPIAGVLALSVLVSTMYLGIHWFSDVVAGTLLAALSVYIGVNYNLDGVQRSISAFVKTHVQPRMQRSS